MSTPRMRIFAGPNGSGKTTLAHWLSANYAVNLYHFVNADVLFAELLKHHRTACPMTLDNDTLLRHIEATSYPESQKAFFRAGKIRIENEMVVFAPEAINSYSVALLADFYRAEYLRCQESFSFETVFSHPAKIDTIRKAKANGFRTYLYFVATEEPKINISRVAMRVRNGGHSVPEEKIVERISRCFSNALEALPYFDRAYFFDNSGTSFRFLAEATNGEWRLFGTDLPRWFGGFLK